MTLVGTVMEKHVVQLRVYNSLLSYTGVTENFPEEVTFTEKKWVNINCLDRK